MDGFIRAVEWAGGTQAALAERLGRSPAAVCKWKARGIPAEVCCELERISDAELTRAALRPDLFGPLDDVA